jgi:hypothetical protein
MPHKSARPRLTKRQRAVLALAANGIALRRRGAFGEHQAEYSDPSWVASITLDKLIAQGRLIPGKGWGTFVLPPEEGKK